LKKSGENCIRIFKNPFEAAEQRIAAVERRKRVAHGATVGNIAVNLSAPDGAKEFHGG
jgi:hypothetical protein